MRATVELDLWRPNNVDMAFDHLPIDDSFDSGSWAHENGTFLTVGVSFDDDGLLGISAPTQVVRLNPLQSCQIAIDNIVATAQSVGSLLNPRHTMEVLDNSTSVVGISVMSAQAAAEGPATFLNLAALISFSLGFMNLLPIPPLDGGKLVIEAIQAVTRRKVPIKVQTRHLHGWHRPVRAVIHLYAGFRHRSLLLANITKGECHAGACSRAHTPGDGGFRAYWRWRPRCRAVQ